MKINNRQNFLVAVTIAVVGLFVAVNFIFTPLAGLWSDRQTQIKDLTEQIKTGKRAINSEKSTRDQWKEMRANALPATTSDAEHQVFTALTGWSRDSGAQITSIMPQWKSDSTNYLTMNCRVETAGDMGTLSKFLYALEKGPMALKLDAVELTSRDATGQQMTLGLEINGLALLHPDKP